MNDWISRRAQVLAGVSAVGGVALFLGIEIIDEPDATPFELMLDLVEILPIVITSVGVALLFQMSRRQHDEQLTLLHDLEVAQLQGQRWRSEARTFLNGLGEAIEMQFSRWGLTEAEREVALLLLKGLSLKEVAAVRSTNERTVRTQARALYSKAGLSGRAALSAFFLEDLLAPIEGVRPGTAERDPEGTRPVRPRTIQ